MDDKSRSFFVTGKKICTEFKENNLLVNQENNTTDLADPDSTSTSRVAEKKKFALPVSLPIEVYDKCRARKKQMYEVGRLYDRNERCLDSKDNLLKSTKSVQTDPVFLISQDEYELIQIIKDKGYPLAVDLNDDHNNNSYESVSDLRSESVAYEAPITRVLNVTDLSNKYLAERAVLFARDVFGANGITTDGESPTHEPNTLGTCTVLINEVRQLKTAVSDMANTINGMANKVAVEYKKPRSANTQVSNRGKVKIVTEAQPLGSVGQCTNSSGLVDAQHSVVPAQSADTGNSMMNVVNFQLQMSRVRPLRPPGCVHSYTTPGMFPQTPGFPQLTPAGHCFHGDGLFAHPRISRHYQHHQWMNQPVAPQTYNWSDPTNLSYYNQE